MKKEEKRERIKSLRKDGRGNPKGRQVMKLVSGQVLRGKDGEGRLSG